MPTVSTRPRTPLRLVHFSASTISWSARARDRRSRRRHARHLGNNALNWLAGYLTGRAIPDLTSGLRAAPTSGLREFLHLLPNGFSTPTTTTLAFVKAGYSVRFEPIAVGARLGKSKIKLVSDGARFLMILLKVITVFSPLRMFLPIAGAFFVLGAGVRRLDHDHAARRHRLLGAADRARGRDFPRRPRLRADFHAALGRTAMNAAVVIATYNERDNLAGLVSAILSTPATASSSSTTSRPTAPARSPMRWQQHSWPGGGDASHRRARPRAIARRGTAARARERRRPDLPDGRRLFARSEVPARHGGGRGRCRSGARLALSAAA